MPGGGMGAPGAGGGMGAVLQSSVLQRLTNASWLAYCGRSCVTPAVQPSSTACASDITDASADSTVAFMPSCIMMLKPGRFTGHMAPVLEHSKAILAQMESEP